MNAQKFIEFQWMHGIDAYTGRTHILTPVLWSKLIQINKLIGGFCKIKNDFHQFIVVHLFLFLARVQPYRLALIVMYQHTYAWCVHVYIVCLILEAQIERATAECRPKISSEQHWREKRNEMMSIISVFFRFFSLFTWQLVNKMIIRFRSRYSRCEAKKSICLCTHIWLDYCDS